MTRRPLLEAFFSLLTLLYGSWGKAQDCWFSQSPLRASLDTEQGQHVELFDEFLRVDGERVSVCNGLPGARPTAIARDGASYLVGFRDQGLFRAQAGGFVAVSQVPHGPVRALARVGDVLYVAQAGPGLFRLQAERFEPVHIPVLRKRRIVALHAEGDALHVALDPTGHVRLDAAGKAWLVDATLPVGCFHTKPGGRVVARTPGPACEHTTRAGELPSAHVSALLKLERELVIATFDAGIVLLAEGRVRAHVMSPRFVNALLHAPEGVYAAGADGLYLAKSEAGRLGAFERVPLPPQQTHINDLARAPDGTLWLATSLGLLGLRAGEPTRLIDTQGGLPSRLVYAVLVADDGALWAGTARGAVRLGREGVRVFNAANGAVQQDWITALTQHRGQMIAGTYDAGAVALHSNGSARAVEETARLWVNPHGLFALDGALLVASMSDGLRRDGAILRGTQGLDVTALASDGEALWVGTRNGLLRLAR
jgi:hypothetical protein